MQGEMVRGHRNSLVWGISVIGLALAIAGTVLMNSVSCTLLRSIPAVLSRMDERDAAWAELTDGAEFPERLGLANTRSPDSEGFGSLLELLRRRNRIDSELAAVSIGIENHMLYGDESQKIGQLAVLVHYEGEEEPRVVAWAEDVSRWIDDERMTWAVTFGFPPLSVGLLLSLVAGFASGRAGHPKRYSGKRLRLSSALVVAAIFAVSAFAWRVRVSSLMADLASLSLILTLLVLIRYAYDTFRMAEVTSTPSASLGFINDPKAANPLLLRSLPRNYSRVPLELWCEVRITLLGHSVVLERFYGGKTPWYLQPYQKPVGVLDLSRIIEEAGKREEDLREGWESAADPDEKHRILRLDVKFTRWAVH